MKLVTFISVAGLAWALALPADGVDPGAGSNGTIDPANAALAPDDEADVLPAEPEGSVPAAEDESALESGMLLIDPALLDRETEDPVAPNQLVFERFILRGAAVQWFKTDNLLQLFNPFAPERYGSGEQNLAHDAITGRPKGLTIIAIDFGGKRDRR
jgi:hypothetical protein